MTAAEIDIRDDGTAFGKLGTEVPQGLPGTNPQKMSRAECLVDVALNNWNLYE